MTKARVGINGMGRIGRTLLREFADRTNSDIEIVAINNPGDKETYLHLLRFDSVHGRAKFEVESVEGGFKMNGKKISFHTIMDPSEIPWSADNVDIVIDATGRFKDQAGLGRHKHGTVKKVIMCAPGKDLDGTFVMGINNNEYDNAKHHIISNASCTTNCLAPMAKVLHENFGIEAGFMTTVHSYTADQLLMDGSHEDLRRARGAALSMIPTTTGAAKAVGLVMPALKGKLDGFSIRVPTPNVSFVDLNVRLSKKATKEEINSALIKASKEGLKGILKTEELELVSSDYMGMKESSCIDLSLTNVIGDMVKVTSWYDNEVGFSNRVLDLATMVANKL
ncbi:MAG: type I glyceraldehyde-3-phosphate dehydrogenase [Bdellovibrio sp. CG12_big_fil_rev_8_21_14_0_65_39_13]|nr:MAG: type I glyceraldehyde-3-phosphate dehydrogenase [Bdellovibrio sp. CG22_combo_CG10-13_8_21_14_all_39_27]PIQ58151.1 MAG: type I glyceraldehyde-3-phosphate dehydrogenase [Bdellovibrio sp. CG12_big_fil_rev_8_21_14_0_65_39_13]PIR34313.1 MAG: type I glyceraldehyde-3-phosphate dehydrogenase [Bdellovibrio sp. CG11_big_fil_rev_8_21_14_0_20_39_38]